MKLLLCLAMSLGLSAILYFYMKQKISNIENRLNTLSELLQTLTNEFCKKEVKMISTIPLDASLYTTPIFETNESEEETEEESEGESDGIPELCSESENGETDEETDDDVDSTFVQEVQETIELKEPEVQEKIIECVELPEPEEKIIIQKANSLEINLNEVDESPVLIKVSDDDVSGTKQVNVSVDYSHLSLKDLKQKVNDLGGPPLKTKNALLNFLKNKV